MTSRCSSDMPKSSTGLLALALRDRTLVEAQQRGARPCLGRVTTQHLPRSIGQHAHDPFTTVGLDPRAQKVRDSFPVVVAIVLVVLGLVALHPHSSSSGAAPVRAAPLHRSSIRAYWERREASMRLPCSAPL